MLVDGMPTRTFSLDTLPPPQFEKEEGRRDKVMKLSRERYATPRDVVEDKIKRWSESTSKDDVDPVPASDEKPKIVTGDKLKIAHSEKPKLKAPPGKIKN